LAWGKVEWLSTLGLLGVITLASGLLTVNKTAKMDLESRIYESMQTTGILISALGIVMVSLGLAGWIFGLSRNNSG
jgi:hypothetical protein